MPKTKLQRRELISLIPFLLSFIFALRLLQLVYQTYQSQLLLKSLKSQIQESRITIKELNKKLVYQQSDQFIEQEARNKLNLVKPGERIIILKTTEDSSLPPKNINNLRRATWQEWRYLFLRF